MRGYANYYEQEDLQPDTFHQVSELIRIVTFRGILEVNLDAFIWGIKALYPFIHMKLTNKEQVWADIERLDAVVHGDTIQDPEDVTQMYQELYDVWLTITSALDKEGILYRASTSTDELYKRGNR